MKSSKSNYIPVSGKVFNHEEINNAIKVAKKGWWTEEEYGKRFEVEFKKLLGVNYVTLVNSGSSANLCAVAALTSTIYGERRLKPGDEFITCAVGFPTTVNPGVLYGLKPVFVDIDTKTFNIDVTKLEKAITKKTKLIIVAHTLGIPMDLDPIMALVKKYKLWFIEDCCDALGSRYDKKLVGTFGHMATFSFYPAHQITMGEGGAIITNDPLMHRAIRQFRDWGRDCWCDTGKDNTCGKRFGWKMGNLPVGYDHKYIYSQIGFNLKLTDFQAAIGVAQLKKLQKFIKKRKINYQSLRSLFNRYENFFILPQLESAKDPSWFGFPAIVKPGAPFTRNQFTQYLEDNNIGTRTIFSGNLLRHPAYLRVPHKAIGVMKNADLVMNSGFWIGVYPGISVKQITYMKKTISTFLNAYS